jgi:2,4-dichlorophenol 6-monooxygenase
VKTVEVPVLIVGGGAAGLTSSLLLSSYGVPSLLVSRHPATSHLPKAHVLNQRTMEVFRELDVAEEVLAASTPPDNMRAAAWYAGFAGARPDHGRQIARLPAFGEGYRDANWIVASPCRSANLPQLRLEPILRRRAEAQAQAGVRYHNELQSLRRDDDGVRGVVYDHKGGEQYEVHARYLLGCDGGRTVGAQIGAVMEGPTDLGSNVSLHITADLSRWLSDDDVLIRWYINPDIGDALSCVLVGMGPDTWGSRSREWVLSMHFELDDPRRLDDAFVVERLRHVLGLPDLDVQVHVISRWTLEGIVASRLQDGPVFLLGDAAHRHPPTGGLGLNTAVGDAYNICWKLAAVLAGLAGPRLLDSYETERRPVAELVVRRALENWENHRRPAELLGLSPEDPPEANWRRMAGLWADGADGDRLRRRFEAQIATQTMEFNEHAVEYGYRYASHVIATENPGAPRPDLDPVHVYEPSTRPGAPLPHAWVTRDGHDVALRDLLPPGQLLLIAAEDGQHWCEATRTLAEEEALPLAAVRVAPADGDWLDLRFQWLRWREVSATGAVLVRPDRVIAWRSHDGGWDGPQQLREACAVALGVQAEKPIVGAPR